MNDMNPEMPRYLAIQLLSLERGRSLTRPLDPSLISKWCADLGFEAHLRYYNTRQYQQLRAVNRHYASGGTRKELLNKMRRNPKWYELKT